MFQGGVEDAAPVFEESWPEARAVSDPTLDLYRAFGLGRGGLGQIFGPGVWRRALAARRRGYRQTGVIGDPWMMPGAFLIHRGRVVWTHDYAHVGDTPEFATLGGWERRHP